MKIILTSVMVDDQAKALAFYTDVLGFVKKHDFPMGGDARWLTVTSPEGTGDMELLLEPNRHPAGRAFQQALFADGIPAALFGSSDLRQEHERLLARGVVFKVPPTPAGPVLRAVFEDTCGNLIQMIQPQ
jgi:catechol 2,3-dioxygenase-like lactoylglutathione lyase family enzyme